MSTPNITAGEAQLRMLIHNIPARVALLDRERRHCYVNQEYIQFVGRPVEAILGRTVAPPRNLSQDSSTWAKRH